jgi:general secretion pathway protein N
LILLFWLGALAASRGATLALAPPPPPPKAPERLAILLVGTVASASKAIGVFIETATRNAVRLRIGDDHEGWVLRSLKGRDATLKKGSDTAVLELPPAGGGNLARVVNGPQAELLALTPAR